MSEVKDIWRKDDQWANSLTNHAAFFFVSNELSGCNKVDFTAGESIVHREHADLELELQKAFQSRVLQSPVPSLLVIGFLRFRPQSLASIRNFRRYGTPNI